MINSTAISMLLHLQPVNLRNRSETHIISLPHKCNNEAVTVKDAGSSKRNGRGLNEVLFWPKRAQDLAHLDYCCHRRLLFSSCSSGQWLSSLASDVSNKKSLFYMHPYACKPFVSTSSLSTDLQLLVTEWTRAAQWLVGWFTVGWTLENRTVSQSWVTQTEIPASRW